MKSLRCPRLLRTIQDTHTIQRSRPSRRNLTTLAIETSCDDTAVAILSHTHTKTTLLFNERITSDHREWRGIKPAVAVRGHQASLAPLLQRAMTHLPPAEELDEPRKTVYCSDGSRRSKPDFVSVTRGPGIASNLSVGLSTAKGLAGAWHVPLVGVHHMQAHALTSRLVSALDTQSGPDFPFLSLLVSGGHTQLVLSTSITSHKILATTADEAIGNMLDHAARHILPAGVLAAAPDVMYARSLEAFAFPDGGTEKEYGFFEPATNRSIEIQDASSPKYDWYISQAFRTSRTLKYGFASYGSQVQKICEARPDMDVAERRELARVLMVASFRHLIGRIFLAVEGIPELKKVNTLVVAGGVACNKFLMHVLRSTLAARKLEKMKVMVPPPVYCTDNAAMIAWAGMEMYQAGYTSDLGIAPINPWPLDAEQGPGILGVGGWLKGLEPIPAV